MPRHSNVGPGPAMLWRNGVGRGQGALPAGPYLLGIAEDERFDLVAPDECSSGLPLSVSRGEGPPGPARRFVGTWLCRHMNVAPHAYTLLRSPRSRAQRAPPSEMNMMMHATTTASSNLRWAT